MSACSLMESSNSKVVLPPPRRRSVANISTTLPLTASVASDSTDADAIRFFQHGDHQTKEQSSSDKTADDSSEKKTSKKKIPKRRSRRNKSPDAKTPDVNKLAELRMAFSLLDRNKDGKVNTAEIRAMLDNLGIDGISNDTIRALIKQASTNGENILSEAEFLAFMQKFRTPSPAPGAATTVEEEDLYEDLMAAFMIFDKDQNGYITKDELSNAMILIGEPMSEAELEELLQMSDIDNDGRIDYQEFLKVLLE